MYGADRTFKYMKYPKDGPFDHVCGEREDFEEGGEYRPDLPPVEYRPDWLPVCCAPPEPGGVEWGGTAEVTIVRPTEGDGIDFGGSAEVTVIRPVEAAGLEFGGSAEVEVIRPADAAGVEWGGTAEVTIVNGNYGANVYWAHWFYDSTTRAYNRGGPASWGWFYGSLLTTDRAGGWELTWVFQSGGTYRFAATGWDGTGSKNFTPVGHSFGFMRVFVPPGP